MNKEQTEEKCKETISRVQNAYKSVETSLKGGQSQDGSNRNNKGHAGSACVYLYAELFMRARQQQ